MKTVKRTAGLILFIALLQGHAFCIKYYDISLPSSPPGDALREPAAVNDLNQVVGPAFDFGQWYHPAYFWENGVLTVLPFPHEDEYENYANDINNAGHYVGAQSVESHGQLWNGTALIDLGTLGGSASSPYALNDSDQVVGCSRTSTVNQWVPFLWQNNLMTALGSLGGSYGIAYDINNHGVIVGFSRNAAGQVRAFIYENQTMTDLGTLGGSESTAFAVNDSKEIVGISKTADGYQHAFVWKNGQMTDLGTLGGRQSQAFDINDAGQIIGWAETATGYRPLVVWENGQTIRLNALIAPDSGWELVIPEGMHMDNNPRFRINNNGAILGRGFINRGEFAFLMIPRPDDFLLHDSNRDGNVNLLDYVNFSEEWLK